MPRDTFWLLTLNLMYGPTFALIIKWQRKNIALCTFYEVVTDCEICCEEKGYKTIQIKIKI